MADLVHLRLLKPYRTYRAGVVIHATPGLAKQLVDNGTAVQDRQGSLLEESGRQAAERAVATHAAVETR